jgi:hypothetical protein
MKVWFLALLVSQAAVAMTGTSKQDCSSLDLRDDFLGEVRNQKKISWCYAFAGADMLAHAFKIPEKISAADMAIAYNETKIGKLFRWLDVNIINPKDPEIRKLAHQTGFNKTALITSMKEGWCPESVFSSEQWTKVSKTDQGLKEEQVPLDQAMLEISALHDIRKSLSTENLPFHYNFKNVDAESFVKLLQSKTLPRFYSSLRQLVCRDDRRSFDQVEKVKMVIRFPGIFNRISEQLEGGRIVGLDYDFRILQDSANHKVKISELHTSSIVGRRWNTERNTCEFLIRNSHGDKCGVKYDPTYDCESGNIWLSESQIFNSMTSIVYIL